ncbi:hypothetical protein GGR09_000680 [Bartonella heixiaziensis]
MKEMYGTRFLFEKNNLVFEYKKSMISCAYMFCFSILNDL